MSGSYDFEEQERIAELKAWWEDNRWYVVGAIVAAVLGFVGWRAWKETTLRQSEDAAAMYQPVADASKANDSRSGTVGLPSTSAISFRLTPAPEAVIMAGCA